MSPPDIKADVLRAGGIALLPGDIGYFLVTGTSAGVSKIFTAKNRGAHKRHGTLGSLELQRELHILTPQQAEIIKTISEDLRLPLAVVARYRPEHPMMRHFDEEALEASSDAGTINMSVNVGPLPDELARLAHAENFLLTGSSANPSGTGNRFRLEDIPEEICDLANITIFSLLSIYFILKC